MNKTGFTLMEMLVVVTIIGILASIAIPQYQQAVLKSRYVKMMPLVKSLKQAEEEYYLMHREYAYDFNELGFRFNGALGSSTCGSAEGRDRSAAMRGEGFVLRINENDGLPTIDAALMDGTNTLTAYLIYLDHPTGGGMSPWSSTRFCYCYNGCPTKYYKLCASVSGSSAPASGWEGAPRFRFVN
ncbi:MAG: prepilin-type N-terminal cleavage/methylation domain-containing protein [Elusimicrobiaceae bacterium]|nr:prepilin-type N-terminal cleavage/methylation domain-containing protein [Elusimicrobiaceae bacterium]